LYIGRRIVAHAAAVSMVALIDAVSGLFPPGREGQRMLGQWQRCRSRFGVLPSHPRLGTLARSEIAGQHFPAPRRAGAAIAAGWSRRTLTIARRSDAQPVVHQAGHELGFVGERHDIGMPRL
jgi:hypothetical protein